MRKSLNRTIINVENRNGGDEDVTNNENVKRFIDFIMGSNKDFYDTFLVKLSKEELDQFFKDNPDFVIDMDEDKKQE